MKYVIVSGGVVSGLGKGITSSSVGVLLQACNLHITSIKIDPYLNTDAGTMSPYEHGEVFVLNDGGEADLDLGNYERFLDVTLTKDHNITTGKIYAQVINRERKGDYLGKTVQVVPHITDAIQEWIHRVSHIPVDKDGHSPDVCMIELGGTVGDIESMVFLEALRQYRYRVGNDNFCHIHVSLVPVVGAVGEPKSKPTQHGVRELRAAGLQPDLIICRSTKPLDRTVVGKISQFCMVPSSHVISVHDVSNIYKVPVLLHEQRVASLVLNCLRLHRMPPDDSHLANWRHIAGMEHTEDTRAQTISLVQRKTVKIGIIGKYTGLSDSYLSVTKSLDHAGIANHVDVEIVWIESTLLEITMKNSKLDKYTVAWNQVAALQGILIPGGFGDRGVEGKIAAIRYAREHNVPFLGICLGMQLAVIEYARHMCTGMENATSAEFDDSTEHPVIVYMPEIDREHMGGTMRLGARQTVLTPDTLASQLYHHIPVISERHRHRYEVNPEYISTLTQAGLVFSGTDVKKERMECIELVDHVFFFGCQYHPEFQSRPFRPSPPFYGFVRAAAGQWLRGKKEDAGKVSKHTQNAVSMSGNSNSSPTSSNSVKDRSHSTAASSPVDYSQMNGQSNGHHEPIPNNSYLSTPTQINGDSEITSPVSSQDSTPRDVKSPAIKGLD